MNLKCKCYYRDPCRHCQNDVPKETNDEKKEKPYIRKRKPIDFTMADLDADVEDDNDSTFKPKKKNTK